MGAERTRDARLHPAPVPLVGCPEREPGRGHGRHALAADGRPGRFTVGTGGEGGKEGG